MALKWPNLKLKVETLCGSNAWLLFEHTVVDWLPVTDKEMKSVVLPCHRTVYEAYIYVSLSSQYMHVILYVMHIHMAHSLILSLSVSFVDLFPF